MNLYGLFESHSCRHREWSARCSQSLQFIVCGNQSCGKSSTLERLCDVPYPARDTSANVFRREDKLLMIYLQIQEL